MTGAKVNWEGIQKCAQQACFILSCSLRFKEWKLFKQMQQKEEQIMHIWCVINVFFIVICIVVLMLPETPLKCTFAFS